MFHPSIETTRRELQERSRTLLARRLRTVCWISAFALALFVTADLLVLMPVPNLAAYAVYGLGLGVIVAALLALRQPRSEEWAGAIALVVTTSSCATAASLGVLTDDLVTAPLVFIILAMSSATLFPWGLRPQLAIVALAGASWLWNVKAVTGDFALALGAPTLLMVVAFGASLYIARELERYRLAIEQRNLELRGYRDVVENANDAIVTFDRTGRITGANGAAEAIFERPRSELIGKRRDDLVRVSDPDGFAASWDEALRDAPGGRIFSIEGRRPDGSLVPLEVKAQPILAEGLPIGSQAILRDATEKRVAERMRSDFVAMLSHDMKTPLSSILGFAEMLSDQIAGRPGLDELVARIEANARVAHSLAVNFLDATRLESGSFQLQFERTSLNDVVSAVLRHLETAARAREISIEATLAKNLPNLPLDPRHIDRVVANLVANAIQSSPANGRVCIGTTCENGRVVLDVRDEGPGIPADEVPFLFQRYRRAGSTHSDGGGLGLYVVKQIVEAHGGYVTVDCPTGGGSVFRVAFGPQPAAA
ncbi:MAG: PAS domain-containing sensor histidine kinase [Candidatus Binatia bacterium]